MTGQKAQGEETQSMFGTTMMLTVGQALDRAMNEEVRIRIHVAGEWVSGLVVNTDSQGVVVLDDQGDTCVMRMDAITCVRIPGSAPDDFAPGQLPSQTTAQGSSRLPSQPTEARIDS